MQIMDSLVRGMQRDSRNERGDVISKLLLNLTEVVFSRLTFTRRDILRARNPGFVNLTSIKTIKFLPEKKKKKRKIFLTANYAVQFSSSFTLRVTLCSSFFFI